MKKKTLATTAVCMGLMAAMLCGCNSNTNENDTDTSSDTSQSETQDQDVETNDDNASSDTDDSSASADDAEIESLSEQFIAAFKEKGFTVSDETAKVADECSAAYLVDVSEDSFVEYILVETESEAKDLYNTLTSVLSTNGIEVSETSHGAVNVADGTDESFNYITGTQGVEVIYCKISVDNSNASTVYSLLETMGYDVSITTLSE